MSERKQRQFGTGWIPGVLAFGALISLGWTEESPLPGRIAFGSCCNQDKPQVIWPAIQAQRPDLFLFMGDNIYGDTEDMTVLRKKYARLLAEPGYRKLRAQCQVLATWDDHDYGLNDAGAAYLYREESQRIFLETFEVPAERGPMRRPGIYDAYEFANESGRLQVILLDTRYFRTGLKRELGDWPRQLGPYGEVTEPGSAILGEAQWKWLEETLARPADVRIIVSSIQVMPVDHHWERWQNMPREREKFFALLEKSEPATTLILSGDRHLAEIMRLSESDPHSPGFPVYEITSSGMSHANGGTDEEPNRYRLGSNFRKLNFGLLKINWAGERTSVMAEIKDERGRTVRELHVPPVKAFRQSL